MISGRRAHSDRGLGMVIFVSGSNIILESRFVVLYFARKAVVWTAKRDNSGAHMADADTDEINNDAMTTALVIRIALVRLRHLFSHGPLRRKPWVGIRHPPWKTNSFIF